MLVIVDQEKAFLGGLDLCFGRYDTHQHTLVDFQEPYIFPGKDYSSDRFKDTKKVDEPYVDQLDRKLIPRMPWHDVHCCLQGEPAHDMARHFVQRWNFSIASRQRKERNMPLLTPSPILNNCDRDINICNRDEQLAVAPRGFSKLFAASFLRSYSPSIVSVQDVDARSGDPMDESYMCDCQIVRSVSHWSAGCPTEKSIQNAYIRLIDQSRHFIYIENQFFISGWSGDNRLKNRIAQALFERIIRAHKNKETFRVIVFIPLFPGAAGRPDEASASSLRGLMFWQYRSISRGGNSLYERLFQEVPNPLKYIAFYGLRTHNLSASNVPLTEEIYIHSKTMIIDDVTTIIGSANITDRSQNGDGDSEMAVVLEDQEFIQRNIDGKPTQVGKFAHSFRMKLFEEHFGLLPDTSKYKEFEDPVIDNIWIEMQEIAIRNTKIYHYVFACIPNDYIQRFDQIRMEPEDLTSIPTEKASELVNSQRVENEELTPFAVLDQVAQGTANRQERHRKTDDPDDGKSCNLLNVKVTMSRADELQKIQGHAVYFPLKFLGEESLEANLIPKVLLI